MRRVRILGRCCHRGDMGMRCRVLPGALRVDLRRALGLPFWLCVLLIAAVHIRAVWLSFAGEGSSVVALYNESVTIENYMQTLLPVLVSAVFSTSFLEAYMIAILPPNECPIITGFFTFNFFSNSSNISQ